MNEAELLFTDILNCDRASLYLNRDAVLDETSSRFVCGVLKRRAKGEPIQYILGKAEFMGFSFMVNRDVLIPRPETEILVETAIKVIHSSGFKVHSILDIGTGSGCIAVSLAKFLQDTEITATDISHKALAIARQNAILNKVEINFLQSDIFSGHELRTMNYELIISNPPYIPIAEIETLQPEVGYEPRIALDAGQDGLFFYRRIIKEAPRYLREGGFLIMETGFDQKKAIKNILQKSGYFEIMEWVKDYSGLDRVVVAKKRER
ncbi:MAG: peptide chain release factor N(5)-glutamine methyltransferase [Candidatus Omnitrophota bacterium]